jgi:restriction system protein
MLARECGPFRPHREKAVRGVDVGEGTGHGPAAWLVRGGEQGEREEAALGEGLVIAGWVELSDISACDTREAFRQALKATYPDVSDKVIGNWTGQLWRFKEQIRAGDLVVMPLHTKLGRVAVGRITGPYEYREQEPEGFRQVRQVEWLQTDLPRDAFRPDLRASITSLLTVCGLTRNDAARRVAYLAEHGIDPGMDGGEEITTSEELLEDAASRGPADPRRMTIRSLLEHWDQTRRTGGVVATIKSDLADKGLTTRPPFTEGSVEDEIVLVPAGAEPGVMVADADDTEDVFQQASVTLRIGSLPPPRLVSVLPTTSLMYVKSLMLNRRYSQLAVIDESGRFLGAVSWESIGKAQIAAEHPCLADTIASAIVVDHDALLLEQIDVIYDKGFVFVQGADRSCVNGIVTAADLTRQFGNVARPFVLIEEAENRLRRRAGEVFTTEDFRAAVPSSQRSRTHSAADLSLGNYIYLMRPEENWAKLQWNVDREFFADRLAEVVKVRNELMHFTPDPLSAEQYAAVGGLLEMLRTVDPNP